MPLPDGNAGFAISLKFGAGMNTRQAITDVDDSECVEGSRNFHLDLDNREFRRRKPFDLVATCPNAAEVRGFAQLVKQDGTISTLVQAGGNVYEWDGDQTFSLVGTVSTSAKLRGPLTANFPLNDVVIITDLSKAEVVKTWDGTTFQNMSHNLGSSFYAKYCAVENERAFYGNVTASSATPHLMAASERGNYDGLSVSNRPASGLSDADPFFLLAPDFNPINGLVPAFGRVVMSSRNGRLYQLLGSSATISTTTDGYRVAQFYPDSGASSDEALTYIGNDVLIGRTGRLETLFATENLGDVETDDLTRRIGPTVANYSDWIIAFNSRYQKAYCVTPSNSRMYVLHKAFVDEVVRKIAQRRDTPEMSPWSEWRTQHDQSFQPRVLMTLRDPASGLEETYMGGRSGEIFKLEGGGAMDGGTANIEAIRVSKCFNVPKLPDGDLYDISGFLSYHRNAATTATIDFLYQGESIVDQQIQVTLDADPSGAFFGGNVYFGGDVYFGSQFNGRLARKTATPAGNANQFQVKITIDDDVDFSLNELYAEFRVRT